MTTSVDPVSFNPFEPGFREDPYPTYARLLDEDPVHRSPLGLLVLSRYDDCAALLRDPRSSSDQTNSSVFQAMNAAEPVDEELLRRRPFLFLDPPDHSRLRGLVQKAFTPRTVETLRPRVQQIVDDLLDAVVAKGPPMEVVSDLAYPLPVMIICEMLGVPAEDHETFKGWSAQLARSLDPDFVLPPEVMEARMKAIEEFRAYFRDLIAQRRREPRDDLLTALIAAEEAGDKLTEEELLSICVLLLVAGHETTVNLIANGVLALVRHQDQLDRLRADPSLARSAVEEVLRFDPPVQMTARVALDDIQIGDETLPKGDMAITLLAAANRDERHFPDAGKFDIGRTPNAHLAFSLGHHFCLGAPLARIEGQLALTGVTSRLGGLELAADELTYKENLVLRGLESLPIGFATDS